MQAPKYLSCGAWKTGLFHIRYRQDGNNLTKIVTQSRYKSLVGMRRACDSWRHKNDANGFEIVIEYERLDKTKIFKLASEYVDNNRWINYYV
jgi:hypothetical protein